jgi:uncharacterized zinc-type alcohol dehydrogenase-like protein
MALQFARAFGCEVTAISSTPGKEKQAREFGAHHFLVSTDAEAMKRAAGSLDFILCTAHAPLPWKSLMRALRKNGMLCLVGLNKEDVCINPVHMLVNQLNLCGSTTGGRTAMREMLEFACRAGVRPAVQPMPMAEVNSAVTRLREGQARYRIVLAR